MEVIDSENDEYGWLDDDSEVLHRALQRRMVIATLRNEEWAVTRLYSATGSVDLFVDRDKLRSREKLEELFELAGKEKICKMIFSGCTFNCIIHDIEIPNTVRELIFNNCNFSDGYVGSILSCLYNKNDVYSLRTFVLRKSRDIIRDLKQINFYLSYDYYKLTNIKLINCNIKRKDLNYTNSDGTIRYVYDFTPESEYTKEGNSDFREALEVTKKYLDNNINGYKKCQQVCLTLLGLKRNRLPSMFVALDPNVLMMIVRMIWRSRYRNIWYEDVDPYGD